MHFQARTQKPEPRQSQGGLRRATSFNSNSGSEMCNRRITQSNSSLRWEPAGRRGVQTLYSQPMNSRRGPLQSRTESRKPESHKASGRQVAGSWRNISKHSFLPLTWSYSAHLIGSLTRNLENYAVRVDACVPLGALEASIVGPAFINIDESVGCHSGFWWRPICTVLPVQCHKCHINDIWKRKSSEKVEICPFKCLIKI